MGVTLFLWNYSGYGTSTGSPDPKRIIQDAKMVVSHLKQTEKFTRIGIHGESLGGMVASFVAQEMQLPLLIADRTFSSLGEVIHQQKYLRLLLGLITDWDINTATAFHKAKGYKVCLYDPSDEIIGYFGSLKEGLVRKAIRKVTLPPKQNIPLKKCLQRVVSSCQTHLSYLRQCGPAYQEQYNLLHLVTP